MKNKIAVIVPVYNTGSYLEQCVESILSQSYEDLEVCLVDDGSGDGSGAMCDAFAARDPRVRVIHKENEGLMATWIRGVRETDAPYLFFLDADDWLDRDVLYALSDEISGEEAQIICGTILTDRGEGGTAPEKSGAAPGEYTGEKLEREIREKLLGNEVRQLPFSRCMKLISRALIERNIPFCDPSVRFAEDLNIMVPAFLDAERVVILPGGPYYHYRYVQTSMAHGYDSGLYDSVRRLREVLLPVAEAKKAPQGKAGVEREFLFLLMMAVRAELQREDGKAAAEKIRRICGDEQAALRLREYGGKISQIPNRLAAFVMRRPDRLRIAAARLVYRLKR